MTNKNDLRKAWGREIGANAMVYSKLVAVEWRKHLDELTKILWNSETMRRRWDVRRSKDGRD